MASVQCVRNEDISAQLSVEEKAELSLESQELLDQCIDVVAKNESLDKAATANKTQVLTGALKNQTKGPLTVMATKKYAGHIVKDFPNPLTSAGAFTMSHKGGVVYFGKNKAGVECAWLLAFADTKATGRRIYAECGRKSKFSNIDWADVEHKLNNAGAVAKAHDKETGTSVCATIVVENGKSVVSVTFCG